MNVTHVVGVDPGLVHTGVVAFRFSPGLRRVQVDTFLVSGPDAASVRTIATARLPASVFIEGYRPRSHLSSDKRMQQAVTEMHRALPQSRVLDNTGVKKVVRKGLMELLQVWNFHTVSHHQDLRSAARIALYGMLKDEQLNGVLANVVLDHLQGRTWRVN